MPQGVSLATVTPSPADPRSNYPAPPAQDDTDNTATFGAALQDARTRTAKEAAQAKDAKDARAAAHHKPSPKPTPSKTPPAGASATKDTPSKTPNAKAPPKSTPDDDAKDTEDDAVAAKDQAAKLPTVAKIETAATSLDHPVHAKSKPVTRSKSKDPAASPDANLSTHSADPTAPADGGNPKVHAINSDDHPSDSDSGADADTDGLPDAPLKYGGALKAPADSDTASDPANPAAAAAADPADAADPSVAPNLVIASPAPTPTVAGSQPIAAAAHALPQGITGTFADALASLQPPATPPLSPAATAAHSPPPTPTPSPESQFAAANRASIVKGIQTQLLPNGGSMQIRLDPAELGSMNISVHMRDGVMTATFETTNDHASRLLSHSLGDLKTSLESAGVTIGALHVQQVPAAHAGAAPKEGNQNNDSSPQDQASQQKQQEQQRREMVRRMWRRLNGGKDPLDLVA